MCQDPKGNAVKTSRDWAVAVLAGMILFLDVGIEVGTVVQSSRLYMVIV